MSVILMDGAAFMFLCVFPGRNVNVDLDGHSRVRVGDAMQLLLCHVTVSRVQVWAFVVVCLGSWELPQQLHA